MLSALCRVRFASHLASSSQASTLQLLTLGCVHKLDHCVPGTSRSFFGGCDNDTAGAASRRGYRPNSQHRAADDVMTFPAAGCTRRFSSRGNGGGGGGGGGTASPPEGTGAKAPAGRRSAAAVAAAAADFKSSPCWSCKHLVTTSPFFCAKCEVVQPPVDCDYFELMNLPRSFEIDTKALDTTYKQRLKDLHPDRFGSKSEQEKSFSLSHSSRVTVAYKTLKTPSLRAMYLLNQHGILLPEDASAGSSVDPAFLNEIMDIREAMEECESSDGLLAIQQQNAARLQACYSELVAVLERLDGSTGEPKQAGGAAAAGALPLLRERARQIGVKLQYYHRIEDELHDKLPS